MVLTHGKHKCTTAPFKERPQQHYPKLYHRCTSVEYACQFASLPACQLADVASRVVLNGRSHGWGRAAEEVATTARVAETTSAYDSVIFMPEVHWSMSFTTHLLGFVTGSSSLVLEFWIGIIFHHDGPGTPITFAGDIRGLSHGSRLRAFSSEQLLLLFIGPLLSR
jgi:hypothetical protein